MYILYIYRLWKIDVIFFDIFDTMFLFFRSPINDKSKPLADVGYCKTLPADARRSYPFWSTSQFDPLVWSDS